MIVRVRVLNALLYYNAPRDAVIGESVAVPLRGFVEIGQIESIGEGDGEWSGTIYEAKPVRPIVAPEPPPKPERSDPDIPLISEFSPAEQMLIRAIIDARENAERKKEATA